MIFFLGTTSASPQEYVWNVDGDDEASGGLSIGKKEDGKLVHELLIVFISSCQ